MTTTGPHIIDDLMLALSEYLGIEVVRKNQSSPRPQYPYAGYGVLLRNKDLANLRYPQSVADDTKVSTLYVIPEAAKISLSFYGTEVNSGNPLDALYDLSAKAREWLELIGKSVIESIGIVIDDFGSIQDRTTLLDVTYEYQTGFDFRIRGQREFEVIEDAVDLDVTYNAIDWSDQNESNI
ncbi:LIC_12616 family protein [Leptospira kirschneri]|uniref:phage neck terminator protein n=1 Tax=Leptospira kirschneri TaxID=29507 RepID=UPI00398B5CEB